MAKKTSKNPFGDVKLRTAAVSVEYNRPYRGSRYFEIPNARKRTPIPTSKTAHILTVNVMEGGKNHILVSGCIDNLCVGPRGTGAADPDAVTIIEGRPDKVFIRHLDVKGAQGTVELRGSYTVADLWEAKDSGVKMNGGPGEIIQSHEVKR